MNKTTRRLFSILGLLAPIFALGVTPEPGTPGGGTTAAASTDPTPAPAAGAPAATPPAAPATSLGAMVRAGLAAIKGGQAPAAALATLTSERDTARTERDQARTELGTAQTALTTAQTALTAARTQVEAFCGMLGISAADLAGKDKAGIASLIDARVKAAIGEEIATLGFPARELPAASSTATGTGDTVDDIRTSLNAETDPTKRGQLVVKLRAAQAAAKKPRTV